MTESSNKWLAPFMVLLMAAAIGAAVIGFHANRQPVNPFKVAEADIVHLPAGEFITLHNPDPDKVYAIEAGADVYKRQPL